MLTQITETFLVIKSRVGTFFQLLNVNCLEAPANVEIKTNVLLLLFTVIGTTFFFDGFVRKLLSKIGNGFTHFMLMFKMY